MAQGAPARRKLVDRYTLASGVGGLATGLGDGGALMAIGMTALFGIIQAVQDPEASEPGALLADVAASGVGWGLGRLFIARRSRR